MMDDELRTEQLRHGVIVERLRRKLVQRDKRIEGLEREVASLSHRLAVGINFPEAIGRAVQEALCNVRMIPVLTGSRTAKIVEVTVRDNPKEPR